ncbi:MAG: FAD-dependent oxidoreductase [Gammaproteobacteria bacterium]|nr:FAD-dependent oxidoreductase [Gammaproteobacteria bacterium]
MAESTQLIQCDIAIIGGGAGGLSLAAGAVQLGAKVVLVESGKMGGDCLNYGCVPSKALLEAAKSVDLIKEAKRFGVHAASIDVNFLEVMQHVEGVVNTLAAHDSVARFEGLGVQVIQAPGRFVDKKTLIAGEFTIQAKRFVVATGSSPFVPPISGLDTVQYETNETIFNLKTLPKHLIVIGGGPIGCELAEAFAMLGAKVTILEMFKLLPKDDVDAVAILREHLCKKGIDIYEGIQIKSLQAALKGEFGVQIEQEGKLIEIKGTHLLVSTGRRANVVHLGLDNAGVVFSEKGIEVDARLRSSNQKIYAMGDVVGPYQFTHIANYHAGIVLRNILFRLPAKVNYQAVPWVTYTYPQIAHVGLLLEEALKKPDIVITEASFSDNDRAVTSGETSGKIKVITDKKGCILGVTITGKEAGELILPWVIAVRERKSLRTFTDTIVPYPTRSEISKRVSGEFYKPRVFSSIMRRLVRILLMLG